jgi:hypothetical protein
VYCATLKPDLAENRSDCRMQGGKPGELPISREVGGSVVEPRGGGTFGADGRFPNNCPTTVNEGQQLGVTFEFPDLFAELGGPIRTHLSQRNVDQCSEERDSAKLFAR